MNLYDLVSCTVLPSAETAHGIGTSVLSAVQGTPIERIAREHLRVDDTRLATTAFGYSFSSAEASVIQLYTALIYEGPTIARDINRGLLHLLERDGFERVSEAVGVDL